jgi:hypothetical protein
MGKPLCSNKLLDDARRAISDAKQVRDNGTQPSQGAHKPRQRVKQNESAKAKP